MAANNLNIGNYENNDESIDDFLLNFSLRVQQATRIAPAPEEKDEDLKWVREPAPNAIQWTVGRNWLNNPSTYKYQRQYQVIRDFFELYCPICNPLDHESRDCWGKTQMYLEDEVLLEWNPAERDDVCPKCRSTRKEFVDDGMFNNYNQLHGVVGMRGGKTATTSIIATYFEHRLYNIHYETEGGISIALQQLPGQPFDVTFIASSDIQSQDTIWAHYIARRRQSPWLQRYISWIKKGEAAAPKLPGVKSNVYEELEKSITNGHLNVTFGSMNSNSSGLAGRTRLAAFIDELSRFQNTESRMSADEAYRVLENSLATVRTMAAKSGLPSYLGLMGSISSPISIEDKAMRLWFQSPDIKRMYAFKYPTWLFNPFITRADLDDAFIKDYVGAKRDFGADPPAATSPLIEDEEHFRRQTIAPDLKPTTRIEYYVKTDKVGNQYKAARALSTDFDSQVERFVVFDAGLTFDTFAGAAAHGEWVETEEGPVWMTIFDWILRVLPEKHPVRMDVWFDSVLDIIKIHKVKQRIARVEFDRWNSAHLIQSIRDMSVPAEHKGTVVTDFVKFVADANMGKVRLLPPLEDDHKVEPHLMSPAGTVFYEMARMERSPDLRKIFNPKKGERIGWNSDDVAQCVVHAHRMVQEVIAVDQHGAHNSPEMRLRNETVGGASWARGRGGGRVFVPKQNIGTRGW
jgi:hypothetical protein